MSMSSCPLSTFGGRLAECNGLDSAGWAFHRGMLFGAVETWWADGRRRPTPHEGIDLCLYVSNQDTILSLGGGSTVPAMYDGEVVRLADDFLGRSVFLRHGLFNGEGDELYTFFGHIVPLEWIREGAVVSEGQPIGSVAIPSRERVAPHLHVSLGWVGRSVHPCSLEWDLISRSDSIALVDPLTVIDCEYRIIDRMPEVEAQRVPPGDQCA